MFLKSLTSILCLCILATSSFAAKSTPIQPPKKQRVVLMPIKVSEEDRNLAGAMETALVEGLQERYIVFSGERVQQKTREIFAKESKTAKAECDETKCMEDIAIAFQAELIAVANVTKQDGGYFLAISIQNIFDNKVIYTKSKAYANQTAFEVIDKLKELAGTKTVLNDTPINTSTTIEQKLPNQKNTDTETTVWEEAQKGNTADDYQVYLDTYPNGKYAGFAKARIKKSKTEEAVIPQKITTSQDVFFDKSTGLTWQDNEEARTVKKDWQGAIDYCENLTLAGRSDWRLPSQDELISLSTLGYFGYFDKSHQEWFDINKGKRINELFSNPSLKNVATNFYWSSSEYVSDTTKIWGLNFVNGGAGRGVKSLNLNIRCVCK